MENVKDIDILHKVIIDIEMKIGKNIGSQDVSLMKELWKFADSYLVKIENHLEIYKSLYSRDYICYLNEWVEVHRREIMYTLQKNFPHIFDFNVNVVTPEEWRHLEFLKYDDLTDDEQLDGIRFSRNDLDL